MKIAELVPGVELPEVISERESVSIRLPGAFARQVEVIAPNELAIRGLGQELAFHPGKLDLTATTWDGRPVADLIRSAGAIRVEKAHTLVLTCRR